MYVIRLSLIFSALLAAGPATDGMAAAIPGPSIVSLCAVSTVKPLAAKKKVAVKKTAMPAAASKSAKRYLTFQEVGSGAVYSVIESYMYRMCIQEVPFFLALHACYYKDDRLDKGDTLVLGKNVLQALLVNAANRLNSSELSISPVSGIDSMMIFRSKTRNGTKTTNCNIIVYAKPDAYEIPKSGAKIQVPGMIKGTVSLNPRSKAMTVTVFSKGVKLVLPGYAKMLSLGMISDMDIRYAELVPDGNGFEARLLYATGEKEVKKRGWSFNVTECNKIRPYER